MKKVYLGVLSAVVLLNTACSPDRDSPSTPALQSSSLSSVSSSTAEMARVSASNTSAPAAEMTSAIDNELMNTEWKLITLNNQDIVNALGQREAHIIFNEENRVVLHDGCNQVTGSFNLDGEKLAFSNMVSTRVACEGVTDQPRDFNDALTKIATYSLLSNQLVFRDASGTVVAVFEKATQPDVE